MGCLVPQTLWRLPLDKQPFVKPDVKSSGANERMGLWLYWALSSRLGSEGDPPLEFWSLVSPTRDCQ